MVSEKTATEFRTATLVLANARQDWYREFLLQRAKKSVTTDMQAQVRADEVCGYNVQTAHSDYIIALEKLREPGGLQHADPI